MFQGSNWIFQQDSAPAHSARKTQTWMRDNLPDFLSPSDWPPSSPDLNPLDYKLWDVLEEIGCNKKLTNLTALKRSLIKLEIKFPSKLCVPPMMTCQNFSGPV